MRVSLSSCQIKRAERISTLQAFSLSGACSLLLTIDTLALFPSGARIFPALVQLASWLDRQYLSAQCARQSNQTIVTASYKRTCSVFPFCLPATIFYLAQSVHRRTGKRNRYIMK